jgi:hypothetical protein
LCSKRARLQAGNEVCLFKWHKMFREEIYWSWEIVNGGWETSYFEIVPSSHLRSKGFLALAVLHPRRLFSPSHDSDGPVAWEQQGATYQVIKSSHSHRLRQLRHANCGHYTLSAEPLKTSCPSPSTRPTVSTMSTKTTSPIESPRIRLLSEEIDTLFEHYLQLLHEYDSLRSSLSTLQASVGTLLPAIISQPPC